MSGGGAQSPLATAHTQCFARSSERLSLPHRDFKVSGSWALDDATDSSAVFRKSMHGREQVWIMALDDGTRRCVLDRAVTAGQGWWVSGVQLSDRWLAWQEVGPGDDLVQPVDWKLYAAPIRPATLTLGSPKLIASASNAQAARPLFDLAGSRLFWITTTWTATGQVGRSQLTLRDLETGGRHTLYRSRGTLDTVNIRGADAILGERLRQDSPQTRFVIVRLSDGQVRSTLGLDNEFELSHWPAWRNGWLAWAVLPTAEATYPLMYLRHQDGRVFDEGGLAVDPCIVGPYLFYQTRRSNGPWRGDTVSIRALRLGDMTSFLLEEGDPDHTWWRGTVGAPALGRRYISYLDNTYRARKDSEMYTIVRVYEVDPVGEGVGGV